jgi:AcrR family transcriptional regulator
VVINYIYVRENYKVSGDNMEKEKKSDDKKNTKRQRIKMYFLEAAEEIIQAEGHESVSVRKVANKAGYSYATIYNYFTDLNELLWATKEIMVNKLYKTIIEKIQGVEFDISGIKKVFSIYAEYYFENPNIFRFFYFYRLNRPERGGEDTSNELDITGMWRDTFMSFVADGSIKEQDIEIVAKTIIYAVHGMIALCLSNNGDLTEENLHKDLEKMIDYLLLKKQ